MFKTFLLHLILVVLLHIPCVIGHGYMEEPCMRGSMWRRAKDFPKMKPFANFDDNGLTAGGPGVVRARYPKRVYGVCGDAHADARPRAHETGGTYGKWRALGSGAISKCYAPGATINIRIRITAQHFGEFRFSVCVPKRNADESERCFRQGHELKQTNGKGRVYTILKGGTGIHRMKYRLPKGVTCDGGRRCVLRWYWLTGNSPGSNMKEEYWNCADIQISKRCNRSRSKPSEPKSMATRRPPSTRSSRRPSQRDPTLPPRWTDCSCQKCLGQQCSNCLRIWGPGIYDRDCYVGWTKELCAGLRSGGYHWCG